MAIREGSNLPYKIKGLKRRTVANLPIDNIEEINELANKKPGATAIATGSEDVFHAVLGATDYTELRAKAQRAVAALCDLENWQAEKVASHVLRSAGDPLPTFLGGLEDARHWAAVATETELGAYALAAFEALPAHRQAAFLDHVQGRAAA